MNETEFCGFDMKWAFCTQEFGQSFRSLAYWNRYRKAYWDAKLKRNVKPELFPNGLVCPDCDQMLYDTMQVFPGTPSKMRVKCQHCKFKGERYE